MKRTRQKHTYAFLSVQTRHTAMYNVATPATLTRRLRRDEGLQSEIMHYHTFQTDRRPAFLLRPETPTAWRPF